LVIGDWYLSITNHQSQSQDKTVVAERQTNTGRTWLFKVYDPEIWVPLRLELGSNWQTGDAGNPFPMWTLLLVMLVVTWAVLPGWLLVSFRKNRQQAEPVLESAGSD
jgi:hypothetical protein